MLQELERALSEWSQYYDQAHTDPDPDEARRHASRQQLQEIATCLQRSGIRGDQLRPLIATIHALADLDAGKRPKLLQPSKKLGGQSPPFPEQAERGVAAATVTLLIADGVSERSSLERIALRIASWPAAANRRKWKKGPNQSLEEALKDWREKAMAGGNGVDAHKYRTCLQLFEEFERNGWSRADFVDLLLTKSQRLYR
jgi:hypothetical protein